MAKSEMSGLTIWSDMHVHAQKWLTFCLQGLVIRLLLQLKSVKIKKSYFSIFYGSVIAIKIPQFNILARKSFFVDFSEKLFFWKNGVGVLVLLVSVISE